MSRFNRSYERLSRVYAKKIGVEVRFTGSSFATDGKRIVMPDLPDEINDKFKDPLLSGLVHECLHIEHSPFDQKPEIRKKFPNLYNNMEDIRILNFGRKQYPGMDNLQKNGLTFIREHFLEKMAEEYKDEHSFREKNPSLMLGACLQYRLSGIDDSFFPEEIRELADKVEYIPRNKRWKTGKSGERDAEEVTKKIVEKIKSLKEEKDKEEEKEENKEKTDEEETDEEETEKEEEENEEEDNLDKEDGEDEDEGGEEEEENEEEREEEEEGKSIEEIILEEENDGFEEDLMEEMKKAITVIISNYKKETDRHEPHPELFKIDCDIPIKKIKENKEIFESLYQFQIWRKNVQKTRKEEMDKASKSIEKQTHILKSKILPLLIAEKRSSFMYEQTEGTLDQARLFRIQNGDQKIYKKKVPGRKLNTAISILCDISGSMSNRSQGGLKKVDLLKATLRVLSDSLFALRIPFEIISFCTFGYSCSPIHNHIRNKIMQDMASSSYLEKYNRFVPILHLIIKEFDENYLSAKENIKYLTTLGDNVDCESLAFALERLAQRKENRRILFVLSDGKPASSGCDSDIVIKDIKERIIEAKKSKIEVIGVGIEDESVRHIYDQNCEVIRNASEMGYKLYQSLFNQFKNKNQ